VRIQDGSDLLREPNSIIRIGRTIRVRMPGIKIERQFTRGAVIDEAFDIRAAFVRNCFGVAADLECRINRLQGPSRFFL
jgi:hypothetical protein